jgi:hypothetical protein
MAEPGILDDTSNDALRRMSRVYARMTPSERLRRMQQLTLAVSRLALAGLRRRHPTEGESELLRRLARIRLGADVADEVYGRAPRSP